MIVALLIGRGGSTGFKGKNTSIILGRPMMVYPILAAKFSNNIEKVYLSSDSQEIIQIGLSLGCEIINRPPELATKDALAEDALKHGFGEISRRLGKEPELIALLGCNAPTISSALLDEGIEKLQENQDYDSAAVASAYNMYSPLRAKKIAPNGSLVPFYPPASFGNASCDRDSLGDIYYADGSGFVVRPYCFDYEEYGEIPFRWTGKNVYPIKQWGGLDIDYEWQVGQADYWLKKHGFTEEKTPYDQ